MKKIKLNVDGLRVESFETERAAEGTGTVRAAEAASGRPWTCDPSCDFTCDTMACPCRVSEHPTMCYC